MSDATHNLQGMTAELSAADAPAVPTSLRVPERDTAMPNEQMLDVPFLVYGTLRAGQANAYLIERHGGVHTGKTRLYGYEMRDSRMGFPYASVSTPAGVLESPSGIAVEVVEPPVDDAQRLALRNALDMLEGYSPGAQYNHYDRRAVRFMCPSQQVLRWGWLYIVTDPDAGLENLPLVASGDWLQRS